MAKDTTSSLKSQVIYQVFPRQHSKQSNFKGIIADLARIKDLGTDILYLLPIHPIGEKNKKGSLGCPYSIKDYMAVNPDLGTLADFINLVNETHKLDMKIMIDVVFNHTSRDSYILINHPDWMYQNEKGEFCGKVGDWWDVTDLNFEKKELWDYLLEVLAFWAKLGVDGIRSDVASMVPLAFWLEARKMLKLINPNFIMLAESIDLGFVKVIRDQGFEASCDAELYAAFDMEYDYDIWQKYEHYLHTGQNLNDWLLAIEAQDGRYPKNFIKAHCLENHDRGRVATYIKDVNKIKNLTTLLYFLKGTTFIYAGQEVLDSKLESLFDIDLIDWSRLKTSPLPEIMKKCSALKKLKVFINGSFRVCQEKDEVAHFVYEDEETTAECLFNLSSKTRQIKSVLPDDSYQDSLFGADVLIENSIIRLDQNPLVLIKKK